MKKCVPRKRRRKPSERPSRRTLMGMPLVLELTMAVGFKRFSRRA